MIVIGEREQVNGKISVRTRDGENKNGINLQDFIDELKAACETRQISI